MKRLIVLSVDSLQTDDLEFLEKLPNFKKILNRAAVVKNVREIYPTLTYPIHTTIITGVHPQKHGIFHNQVPKVLRESSDWSIMGEEWYWYSDSVKVKSIVDAANEAGMITASVLWPVMAGKKPHHNLAEIWPTSASRDLKEVFQRSCSSSVMELYYDKYVGSLDWSTKPDFDEYGVTCSTEIIKTFKPHLLLQHIVGLDHARHVHGVNHEEVDKTLVKVDGMLGQIIAAAKTADIYEETNFVILGDHGQIDIENVFNLNVLLSQKGLIQLDEKGIPMSYDAYSFSAGFSTHIILAHPEDQWLSDRVYSTLKEIQSEYPQYIERIYTKEEAAMEEGLSGDFSFVVEGTEGTMFHNHMRAPLVRKKHEPNFNNYKGMHGHSPKKGQKPPFLVFGPDVKEGIIIESGDMLDECPTLASLLGIEMKGVEGKPFDILV